MKTIRENPSSIRQSPYRSAVVSSFTRSARLAILQSAIWLCTVLVAGARPGDLDTTFGTNGTGKVIMHFDASAGESARSVVVQRDGRIILAGGSNSGIAARFNPNGTLDKTFGSQGILNPTAGDILILDANDRFILFGGRHLPSEPTAYFHMNRYSPNGIFDTTFGVGGDVTIAMGSSVIPEAGVVQPDGKIIVVGMAQSGAIRRFGVVRCTPDGRLDSTFGSGGRVTPDFGKQWEWAHGVALQPDGKIVVAGSSEDGWDVARFAVARYTTNGALDTTFNGSGKAAVSFEKGSEAFAVALQRDGKIVLAGWVNLQMALARFNPNGTVDTSFGANGTGVITNREGNWDSWQKVIVQPDQKIIAYGHSAGSPWLVVKRYTTNGIPDPTFGIPPGPFRVGTALIPIGTQMSEATGITLQPNGKILIAATAYETNSPYSDVAVARLENDAVFPPSITCSSPVTVNCGESATVAASVSDPSGLPLTVVWDVNGVPVQTNSLPGAGGGTNFVISFTGAFPMGTNAVTLTVTDSQTNTDSCSTSVVGVDVTPPVFSWSIIGPSVLWPPNHRLVEIYVNAGVTDNCDDSPTWKIVQVSSNESSNGSETDWVITGDHTLQLRAERSGGNERIYSVTIQAFDSSGNFSAPSTFSVVVPETGKGHQTNVH